MRIMTILGTRPELIRLSRVIPKLDAHADHCLVHTGQNYDASLKEKFFAELGIRPPDHELAARGSLGQQLAVLLPGCEKLIRQEKPDRLLLLGDTNSSLSALVAKRLAVPVYHLEAGNRCFDDRVPEEVNRRVIDHCSDVWLCYTERSRQNLLREGIPIQRTFVTGNPIGEVLRHFRDQIEHADALRRLGLARQRYFLVTLHRAENVDVPGRLGALLRALDGLQREHGDPVIVSTHPHTRSRLEESNPLDRNPQVRFLDPFGFFDFVALEKSARCVLTDSGTVQEECALFSIPNVTLRDVTERPETIECGSNILAGADPEKILACVRRALSRTQPIQAPPEYLAENVSDTIVNLVLGHAP